MTSIVIAVERWRSGCSHSNEKSDGRIVVRSDCATRMVMVLTMCPVFKNKSPPRKSQERRLTRQILQSECRPKSPSIDAATSKQLVILRRSCSNRFVPCRLQRTRCLFVFSPCLRPRRPPSDHSANRMVAADRAPLPLDGTHHRTAII